MSMEGTVVSSKIANANCVLCYDTLSLAAKGTQILGLRARKLIQFKSV